MKIELLDNILEKDGLDVSKVYEVIKTEKVRDDVYYFVENEKGIEVGVHELLAKEISYH